MSGALTALVTIGEVNDTYMERHPTESRRTMEQYSSLMEGEQYDDGRLNEKHL